MKRVIYNAQNGETTISEAPASIAIEPLPDPDAELAEAINAATTITQLKAALLGENGVAKVKGKLKVG
jgi:hypothetical protein